MNGFDLCYFYDFRNSTKIAVMFYLGSDAFTYLSSYLQWQIDRGFDDY